MTTTQQTDLKQQLQELLNQSEAIQSLPAAQKKAQIERMLSATPSQMKQLITVFEEEVAELQSIDEEFLSHEEEINELITVVKKEKSVAKRKDRIEKEKVSNASDQEKANMLLKKLDDIL